MCGFSGLMNSLEYMVPLTEMENLENEREKSGQFLTGLIEITTIYLGRNIPRAILEIVPAL